jgi:hypothetical protein
MLWLALSLSLTSTCASWCEVRGALGADVIRRELRLHRNELRGCYERELVRRRAASGRAIFELTIDSDGWTRDVAIDASAVGGAKLEQCLRARAGSWRFPSMRFQGGAGLTRIRYGVVFSSITASRS